MIWVNASRSAFGSYKSHVLTWLDLIGRDAGAASYPGHPACSDVRCQGLARRISGRSRTRRRSAVHDIDRAWVEAELKDVGDQALMRGLATAFPIVRPGLFLSYSGRRPVAGHKAFDGHFPAVVPPPPMREFRVATRARSACLRLPGNGPHEAGQFAGDRSADHRWPLAASTQRSVPGRQAALRLPCDLAHAR